MAVFERQVLDALPITIYTTDLEGRITSANRAWSRFARANGASGLADEQAVAGCSIFEAIADPALREQIERALTILRTGRAPAVRWEFPCSSRRRSASSSCRSPLCTKTRTPGTSTP